MPHISDSILRSLLKTITYRLLIIISTFIISLLVTKSLQLSIGITTTASVANTILYFLHERIWNKILWGKSKHKK